MLQSEKRKLKRKPKRKLKTQDRNAKMKAEGREPSGPSNARSKRKNESGRARALWSIKRKIENAKMKAEGRESPIHKRKIETQNESGRGASPPVHRWESQFQKRHVRMWFESPKNNLSRIDYCKTCSNQSLLASRWSGCGRAVPRLRKTTQPTHPIGCNATACLNFLIASASRVRSSDCIRIKSSLRVARILKHLTIPNSGRYRKSTTNKPGCFNAQKLNQDFIFRWQDAAPLSQPVAYSSVVSTPLGLLCMGGEDARGPTDRAFLLSLQESRDGSEWILHENDIGVPDLPKRCTAGGAALIDHFVYLVAGQVIESDGRKKASRDVWRIDLRELRGLQDGKDHNQKKQLWKPVPAWPESAPPRMFPIVSAQHDGFSKRMYVIGGRRYVDGADQDPKSLQATSEVWSFDPNASDSPWKRHRDAPTPLTAGTAVPIGPSHIVVPAAATLEIYHQALDAGVAMQDFDHPGFPKSVLGYHTITDTWIKLGETEETQVTTPAVVWDNDIYLISGEIRPRVRTNKVRRLRMLPRQNTFGWVNMTVVVLYLTCMVAIGGYFALSSRSTDDYFRGGKGIPLVGCGLQHFRNHVELDHLHGDSCESLCAGLGLLGRQFHDPGGCSNRDLHRVAIFSRDRRN